MTVRKIVIVLWLIICLFGSVLVAKNKNILSPKEYNQEAKVELKNDYSFQLQGPATIETASCEFYVIRQDGVEKIIQGKETTPPLISNCKKYYTSVAEEIPAGDWTVIAGGIKYSIKTRIISERPIVVWMSSETFSDYLFALFCFTLMIMLIGSAFLYLVVGLAVGLTTKKK